MNSIQVATVLTVYGIETFIKETLETLTEE